MVCEDSFTRFRYHDAIVAIVSAFRRIFSALPIQKIAHMRRVLIKHSVYL